jgi:diguanylate cyclase (GGDEF)-like protein
MMSNPAIDGLTGIFGSRQMQSDLASALRGSKQLSYIMADLDEFKIVNDTFGHEAGDNVLRGVAQAFADKCASTRSCLGPYRFGGESFGAILIEVEAGRAVEFAESLRIGVEQLRVDAHPELRVTARFAVVTAPVHELDGDSVERYMSYFMGTAHAALYCRPKGKKPNKVVDFAQSD